MVSFVPHGNNLRMVCNSPVIIDSIRSSHKICNPIKRFNQYAQPFLYPITKLGTFKTGMFHTMLQFVRTYFPNEPIDVSSVRHIVSPIKNFDMSQLELSTDKITLRDYQEKSIRKCLTVGRGVCVLPTGAGKSAVIYFLIKNLFKYFNDGRQVLVVVPNIQLVSQMAKDFVGYGLQEKDVCMFSSFNSKPNLGARIIVANTQFLKNHMKRINLDNIGACMVDEVHMLKKDNEVSSYIESLVTNIKYGFTGTLPEMLFDKWNVEGLTGPILIDLKAHELQKQGHIAKVEITAIKLDHGVDQPMPDFTSGDEALDIAKKMFPVEWKFIEDSVPFMNFIVNFCKKLKGNTILMFDHTDHGRAIESMFNSIEHGKRILFINGEVDIDSREEIREIMEQNDNCLCIANTKCVGTGMNIKKIDNIVFAFTTGLAIVKIIQAIGRGLRLYDGKDHVKIIDVYHDFKYSKSHFAERCDLYKKNYGDDVPIRSITFNI